MAGAEPFPPVSGPGGRARHNLMAQPGSNKAAGEISRQHQKGKVEPVARTARDDAACRQRRDDGDQRPERPPPCPLGALAALDRLMGLLLTAIAIEMLLNGIRSFIEQLQR